MIKKLIKHGNSLALVIEKSILDRLGADSETTFDIAANDQVLILTPVHDKNRAKKFKKALDAVNNKYPKALKMLAE